MCSCSHLSRCVNQQRQNIPAKPRGRRIVADCILLSNVLFVLLVAASVQSAETAFLGGNSCSSSGCHGGAGAQQNQSLIWSRQDPHSRAAATLTTARSKRIGQVLKIGDVTKNRSCTSCHSPWQGLPADLLAKGVSVHGEAVSCETCHGAAADWIRSHTRPDLTRAQKSLDGLRDLTILYNRANACVACHQVLEPKLIDAGHPELLFELDGQSSSMPRHWVEDREHRTKAWLTGQAAALRELTAQTMTEKKGRSVSRHTSNQWDAVLWILGKALPGHKIASVTNESFGDLKQLQELHRLADSLAIEASIRVKPSATALLRNLSGTTDDFKDASARGRPSVLHAERLVLSLDRLAYSLPPKTRQKLEVPLHELFSLVQSRPAFDGATFSRRLAAFRSQLEDDPANEQKSSVAN